MTGDTIGAGTVYLVRVAQSLNVYVDHRLSVFLLTIVLSILIRITASVHVLFFLVHLFSFMTNAGHRHPWRYTRNRNNHETKDTLAR